jgi:hypothetical protein
MDSTSSAKVKDVELLADDSGWYWLVTFGNPGAVISGYSVVHADGYVLERARGSQIVASVNSLMKSEYVGPDVQEPNAAADEARARYIDYLIKEYGYITLEGLPADQEVGSRSLRLENIFVPLSLESVITSDAVAEDKPTAKLSNDEDLDLEDPDLDDFEFSRKKDASKNVPREPVGKVLASNDRLALLGSPGAGKTTLLKRLAVAYAAPGRRTESKDRLPERDWFPVVIRCRHLGPNVSQPILKAVEGLAERAEMPELRGAFRDCVTRELRAGRVLLLVDGLDEIASSAERSTFVGQLRTFMGTYPSASLVVTSREFGFRTVAGAVASLCTTYRVAELSDSDVRTITLAWHREVVGPSAAVRASAMKLADSILETDRVRRLAVNPLLLTTLLLVRRWLGELPRKRSVLYAKAIEVLLMTWNVEGHQPLDPDEALPQLAFAAFCMMQRNVQSVSVKELTDFFSEARRQMPELLGYSRISVSEFVGRVEERSSLLSLSGHVIEDGQLRATYEFKHLTFQEYLAALAAAEGYYPDRREGEQLVDVLEPYITKPSWREVLPLAGVLGGRSSSALIERIIDMTGPREAFSVVIENSPPRTREDSLVLLLSRCLADDVPLVPDTLIRAIETVLTRSVHPPIDEILSGRYSSEVYRIARNGYASLDDFCLPYGSAIGQALYRDIGVLADDIPGFLERVHSLIESPDPMERAEGCLLVMSAAFINRRDGFAEKDAPVKPLVSAFTRIRTKMCRMLEGEDDPRVLLAGFWALCWLIEISKPTPLQITRLLSHLWPIWQTSSHFVLQRQCAWTIWMLPRVAREEVSLEIGRGGKNFLKRELRSKLWQRGDRHRAAITMGSYLQAPWTDHELIELAREIVRSGPPVGDVRTRWWRDLMKSFGQVGMAAIREEAKSREGRETRGARRTVGKPR